MSDLLITNVTVVKADGNGTYYVEYRGQTIPCIISGSLRATTSTLNVGDVVDVELSEVNLTRGKITNKH